METQLALGLLLARSDKPDDARIFLEAATSLEPSSGDPAGKREHGGHWRSWIGTVIPRGPNMRCLRRSR